MLFVINLMDYLSLSVSTLRKEYFNVKISVFLGQNDGVRAAVTVAAACPRSTDVSSSG